MFIKLTTLTGFTCLVRPDDLRMIRRADDGASSSIVVPAGLWVVKETPEEIMALIEGNAEPSDVPLIEGTFEWAMAHVRHGSRVMRDVHTWNMANMQQLISVSEESILATDWKVV